MYYLVNIEYEFVKTKWYWKHLGTNGSETLSDGSIIYNETTGIDNTFKQTIFTKENPLNVVKRLMDMVLKTGKSKEESLKKTADLCKKEVMIFGASIKIINMSWQEIPDVNPELLEELKIDRPLEYKNTSVVYNNKERL